MRDLTVKAALAPFVFLLAAAAAGADDGKAVPRPAPAPPPLAVQAMSKFTGGEHFPVKGDSGSTSSVSTSVRSSTPWTTP